MENELDRRIRGIQMLCAFLKNPRVCAEIEYHVYCYVREDCSDYEAKLRQIGWNCKKKPDLLNIPMCQLVQYDDSMLASGTDVDTWMQDFKVRNSHFASFLEDKNCVEDGVLKCRRCNSCDISIHQKQTRSADEGITNFCECLKCGLRWKL
jgi:transcription elongation factor S-II